MPRSHNIFASSLKWENGLNFILDITYILFLQKESPCRVQILPYLIMILIRLRSVNIKAVQIHCLL